MTQDATTIAETLQWVVGHKSPTGRRCLDIRPASQTLLSASGDPEASLNVLEPSGDDDVASGLPNDPRFATLDWPLDDAELRCIRRGFAPTAMEDKWRIVAREDAGDLLVYFRRSWTNELIFLLTIQGGHAKQLVHAKEIFRPELTARGVIEGYLLGRPCVIPAPRELGTDRFALMSYGISIAGRRCDFVEPEDARTWFVSLRDPGVVREYQSGNAIDRQLPREVCDESMGSRYSFSLPSVLSATVAMLRPERTMAVEGGTVPTDDSGLDHDELTILRRWLDGISTMDEGGLRRTAASLGLEPRPEGATEDLPSLFFGTVPESRWLVWGRGRPANEELLAEAKKPVRAHVLAQVRKEDPRFAVARDGWAVSLIATGAKVLTMIRGDAVVRGFSCTGARRDPRDEQADALSEPTHHPESGRVWAWQLARTGRLPPTQRTYWVLESLLLAGAYPDILKPGELEGRVESIWRAGVRTFVSLVGEKERSPTGAKLRSYTDLVAKLSAQWGERATCIRLPIRDLSTPTEDAMRTILNVIDLSVEGGRPVYVHCLGGVGRTATVVGCWLRRHGLASHDDVLAVIAKLRAADVERADRLAPETPVQRDMVLGWEG